MVWRSAPAYRGNDAGATACAAAAAATSYGDDMHVIHQEVYFGAATVSSEGSAMPLSRVGRGTDTVVSCIEQMGELHP